MATPSILQSKNQILREKAKDVAKKEFNSPSLLRELDQMKMALETSTNGIAIAAPQIGIRKRIFVVSPKAFKEAEKSKPLIYINPIVTKRSVQQTEFDEGCLSVESIYGKIKRSEKVTVAACDAMGVKFTRGASGLLAEIFQHEIDHLDGILFIDSAYDLHTVDPKEKERPWDNKDGE